MSQQEPRAQKQRSLRMRGVHQREVEVRRDGIADRELRVHLQKMAIAMAMVGGG